MADLTALDVIVLLMIGLGALVGAARGFVTEVLSLLAWVAAIFAVRFFYPMGKGLAVKFTGTDAGGAILAFAVIFLTAYIGFRFIAGMLGRRTRSSVVGPVDRLLGFGFGGFKGLIGASVVFLLCKLAFDVVDPGEPRPDWLARARTAPVLDMTARTMVDFVEQRRRKGGARSEPGDAGYSDDQRDGLDNLLDRARDGLAI